MNVRPADTLVIAVAQLNSTVGDVTGNAEKVRPQVERLGRVTVLAPADLA